MFKKQMFSDWYKYSIYLIIHIWEKRITIHILRIFYCMDYCRVNFNLTISGSHRGACIYWVFYKTWTNINNSERIRQVKTYICSLYINNNMDSTERIIFTHKNLAAKWFQTRNTLYLSYSSKTGYMSLGKSDSLSVIHTIMIIHKICSSRSWWNTPCI